MAESEVSINVQEIADSLPADENTNSMREAPLPETTTCMSKSLPVLRVEELKDELNNSFSYTSGEEDHSPQASDDPERKDVQEEDFVPPTDELRDKIIKQVEFYFSDANILKDAFLLKHVRRNKLGYVSIKLITSFKKMKSLTKDYRAVAYSLRQSDNLEVNEEGKKVRRKNPLPEFDETTPSRSVLAINLPMENPSIENIAEMFSKCGEVALIRILKPNKSIPQDIKKHSNKHPEIGTTICAVIEFEKHDHAQKAVDTMCDKDDWKRGMRVVLLSENKKKSDKSNDKNHSEKSGNTDIHEGSGDDDKKKKKRGGRRNKNRHFDSAHHDDSACYSSGSEHDPPSRHNASLSPNQNQMDGNKLSPTTSPRSSPRSSPMTSPRSQRRRLGPHGKSPLAEHSPGSSPKPSPRSSPESGRKRYDYSSGGDSTPSSPWVQRRLKAAQELSKSPLVGNSPVGSPMLGRKSTDGPRKLADLGGITRQPKGPDGTRGFHLGRGKPRASTFS
ncbi:la-related protein 6-like [Mercenaria mercenaria]|uniref:la-related protein 6-like n=1 Tax=Mercenaria mercenaria TaxID=6596 RepID=UPI00234E7314|nr:la-related protein 6-like [Mercenaria mercenaria]